MKKYILLLIISLILLSSCASDSLEIGVLSDIHGNLDAMNHLLNQMQDVDVIVVIGDMVLNEKLRYGKQDTINDEEELISILKDINTFITQNDIPVYIIPGNHETKESYRNAFETFEAKSKMKNINETINVNIENIKDMSNGGIINIKGFTISFLPGYYTKTNANQKFLPDDGFFLSDQQMENLILPNVDLIVSHGPPKTEEIIDKIYSGSNVGSKKMRDLMLKNNIKYGIFGHIHEGKGTAKPTKGSVWFNPGAVEQGNAGTLKIGNRGAAEAKYTG
jgi:Icc-related predicted phosphoesterase